MLIREGGRIKMAQTLHTTSHCMQKDLQSYYKCTKAQPTLGGSRNSAISGRQIESVIEKY